jgi:hypothetical protein
MGFSKDLFMDIRAIEEQNNAIRHRCVHDHFSARSAGSEDEPEPEPVQSAPTLFRVGYKMEGSKEWIYLTGKADMETTKREYNRLYFANVKFRKKYTLWFVPQA